MKSTVAHRISAMAVLVSGLCLAAPLSAEETTPAPALPATPPPDVGSMPKWSEFPAPPENVPTVAQLLTEVNATLAKRTQLREEVRALVWDPEPLAAIEAEARSRIDPARMAPIDTAISPAEIEAMAAELRRRATPPPVVQ